MYKAFRPCAGFTSATLMQCAVLRIIAHGPRPEACSSRSATRRTGFGGRSSLCSTLAPIVLRSSVGWKSTFGCSNERPTSRSALRRLWPHARERSGFCFRHWPTVASEQEEGMTTALPWLKATIIEPRDPLWIAYALGVICVAFALANFALIWARSREIPEFRKQEE